MITYLISNCKKNQNVQIIYWISLQCKGPQNIRSPKKYNMHAVSWWIGDLFPSLFTHSLYLSICHTQNTTTHTHTHTLSPSFLYSTNMVQKWYDRRCFTYLTHNSKGNLKLTVIHAKNWRPRKKKNSTES